MQSRGGPASIRLCTDRPARGMHCTWAPGTWAPGAGPFARDSSQPQALTVPLTPSVACPLRLQSAKGDAMRTMIRSSFKANVGVKDEVEINKLKMRAILGIQNYVIHESTRKAMARRGKP